MKNDGMSRRGFLQAGMWTATGLVAAPILGCNAISSTASHRPGSFQGKREIHAAFQPTDQKLYRRLLPGMFDMPDELQLTVAIIHFHAVTAPLVPYHEGFAALACKHGGQPGVYILTMPVSETFAHDAGRTRGYPKYIADRIDLAAGGGVWTGQILRQGQSVMRMSVALNRPATTRNISDLKPTVFNLLPIGVGPQVVVAKAMGEVAVASTPGSATLTVHPGEAWSGLLTGATQVSAEFKEVSGNWYGSFKT